MPVSFPPARPITQDPRRWDFIGDSRTQYVQDSSNGTAFVGTSSNSYFAQANAILGRRMLYGFNQAIAGYRTDQYLTDANLAPILTSKSRNVLFGFPAINDINQSSAGYTDLSGNAITTANVSAMAAANVIAACNKMVNAGKLVFLAAECGANNMGSLSSIVFDFNLRLRAYSEATPGVIFFSLNSVLWNPTGSTTIISFVTGYLRTDNTHHTTLGAYAAGQAFANIVSTVIPYSDLGPANLADQNANNGRQLISNPLFTTLTGGANYTGATITGSVPAGCALQGPGAFTYAFSSAADPNGFGNDVTLSVTANAAGTASLLLATPASGLWNLGDVIQGGVDVAVASGSSHMAVDFRVSVTFNSTTLNFYDLNSSNTALPGGDGPTTAYSYRLQSLPWQVPASGTKGNMYPIVDLVFSAAGSGAITLKRPTLERRY